MSTATLRMEAVASASLPDLATALANGGLPSEDLAECAGRFYRFSDDSGATVGFGGLEFKGVDALLRSVLVLAPLRRRGLGGAIVASFLDHAAMLGVRRVFLLTTTAADFFAALGFVVTARAAVPEFIAATTEFSRLCPASAICMTKTIAPRS